MIPGFEDPVGTYSTNVMGTVNLLEAVRQNGGVKACVVVTSDKVYKNKEKKQGYSEGDELGGDDPYAGSKACAEAGGGNLPQCFSKRHDAGGNSQSRQRDWWRRLGSLPIDAGRDSGA